MLTVILWLGFLLLSAVFVLLIALVIGYIVLIANGIKSLLGRVEGK